MRNLKTLLFLFLLLGQSLFCWALTLEQAKTQGRVGETLSGYLAPIQQDPETTALVQQVNQGRRQCYQEIAQRSGISVTEVAQRAGQKLVEQAKPGEWVQGLNQQWQQK